MNYFKSDIGFQLFISKEKLGLRFPLHRGNFTIAENWTAQSVVIALVWGKIPI